MPWVNAWVAHLLSVQRATATVEDDQAAGNSNLSGYNKLTIDAFSSCVIIAKAGTAHTRQRINVMTQALHIEDSSLPQGLMVQNTCTKQIKWNKNVVVVVSNSMAYPKTLRKKTLVVRAVTVTQAFNIG